MGVSNAEPPPQVGEGKAKAPKGIWIKCDGCKDILYKGEVERNNHVCPKCQRHFRIGSREWMRILLDPDTFQEMDARLQPLDPLGFVDSKAYPERVKAAKKDTGLEDAITTGVGTIGAHPVVIGAMEFFFMGGSMASVVGEKITRAVERAITSRSPLILVSCTGGARMQEGVLSLMQMAKTSAALARLGRAGIPYISLLADPTTGGVTASFSMLGDIIIAEPKALIGFAGPRVIQDTIRQALPAGFQRAEFVQAHGFVDLIVDRRQLREVLTKLLAFFAEGRVTGSQ
ncbi:MAG: acetyl-CoA carboxylase carboxyltransferase subunit beta [candidate division NC10 bacterium]|nr:acetyl-CoA carboxylase carboxyltransferase subunit beta [candidate division NC10 bacterium]